VKLDYETQLAFEAMIDDSILKRYDGDLERLDEGHHGEIGYRPLDIDYVRDLLIELWGGTLTTNAIEEAFERLMDRNGEWPHGYCQEDEDERPLSDFRTEEDEAFDWFEAVRAGEVAAEV